MKNSVEIKQKIKIKLWIKLVTTISLISFLVVLIVFSLMNLPSKDSKASDWSEGVNSVTQVPVLWVRADDNSNSADGSTIALWSDRSSSSNHVRQTSSAKSPKFYKYSDHINTLGLFQFDGSDDAFIVNNTSDINTGSSYQAKSIYMVFRSGIDITSRQVIYEEGGSLCGLNVYIDQGYIYTGIYNKKTNPDWYFYAKEMIEQDKAYSLSIIYDYSKTLYKSYLNSELIDSTHNAGWLSNHSGGIGIGNINSATLFHDHFAGKGSNYYFTGALSELIYFNNVTSEQDRELIENSLTGDYYLNSEGSSLNLPIELLSFTAERVENEVRIDWQTASELNNSYFTIEKSLDGNEFYDIGQVQGAGTSSQAHTYTFIDNEQTDELVYYRLRQTDYDGVEEQFSMVAVKGIETAEKTFMVSKIYPNPFESEIHIQYESSVEGGMSIMIYDSRGVCVVNRKEEARMGRDEILLQGLEGLSKGTYYCIIELENKKSATIKLIK